MIFILLPVTFAVNEDIDDNYQQYDDEIISIENTEIHVETNGNDENSGDADNPVATITKAINISSNNSKIIIHEGVYKENNLNITKSLEIQGQGNVVIDAENKSRIFTINTATSDKVLISGITFTNAKAYQGGAIFVRNAQTIISNSKFINNTALTEGGAIYWNSDNGMLTNTIIESNYARDGAGVSWGGINSTFTGGDYGQVINCTFTNNHLMQEEDACVGLSVYSNRMKIINSTFTNHNVIFNSSYEVLYINGDYSTVANSKFINNSMTLTGALGFDGNYAEAYNNIFINNTVSFNDSFGAAIGVQSETANIYNNTFISNGGASMGGAIYINTVESFSFNFINITCNKFISNDAVKGAGIFADGKSNMLTLIINNNIFTNDKADCGGAIYLTDIYNPIKIENNTFNNETAQEGSAIYGGSCILNITNNNINSPSQSGDIYFNGEIQKKLNIKVTDTVATAGQPVTIKAILTDEDGFTYATKSMQFFTNGEKLTGSIGSNSITTVFNSTGSYTITPVFDNADIENGTVTVLNGAKINIGNITNYGNNVNIRINLTDSNGKAISNKNIIVNLKNNEILIVSDNNGIAELKTTLDFGNYTLTAKFGDDKTYKSTNVTSTVRILSSIVSDDMTRAYNSGLDFKAKLLNSNGSPLTNTNIVLNINGEEYNSITDNEGIINFNEKLSVGAYTITVTNPVTGEAVYNNLNIVKRITGNSNINMYYTAQSSYKVQVFDDEGNIASTNETVKITVNGKSYDVKTDDKGYATFKINLKPKTYTITATYKDVKVSNKIIVKPVLTAKNISKKKSKKIKFQAKLVNTKGKAVKSKKITFKFKGKKYTAKTNKKGIATITLKNLKVGKYSITTKYGKSTIKNTIKIKK